MIIPASWFTDVPAIIAAVVPFATAYWGYRKAKSKDTKDAKAKEESNYVERQRQLAEEQQKFLEEQQQFRQEMRKDMENLKEQLLIEQKRNLMLQEELRKEREQNTQLVARVRELEAELQRVKFSKQDKQIREPDNETTRNEGSKDNGTN